MARQPTSLTLPGPPPDRFLGRTGNVLRLLRDPLSTMGDLFTVYGPLVSLVAGGGTRFYSPRPDCPGTVFVCGPELGHQILSQPDLYHHYPATGRLYPLAADVPPRLAPLKHMAAGLFALNGEAHQRHRRIMRPVFHKQHVSRYLDGVIAQTQAMLARWAPGSTFDIHAQMVALSLRVAMQTFFGPAATDLAAPIGRQFQDALALLVHPLTLLLPYDAPGLPYHRFLNLADRIDRVLRQVVTQKRADASPGSDVLALLLQARDEDGTGLTEDDLIGHTSLLFAAGHETTANALAWTLFLLSQHPDSLAAVYAELDDRLQGKPPTAESLDELTALEHVLLESMRVLPPVPWLPRIAAQASEVGGHTLPAGTELIVSIFHTHRLADLYPQPERFWPQRWTQIQPSTFEYLAFGGGPHRCLGAAFAMLELKAILAVILQRFCLRYDRRRRLDPMVTVTLAPRGGLSMRVCARNDGEDDRGGGVQGGIRQLVALPN